MGDEHDSWLGKIGVDVDDFVSGATKAAQIGLNMAQGVAGAIPGAILEQGAALAQQAGQAAGGFVKKVVGGVTGGGAAPAGAAGGGASGGGAAGAGAAGGGIGGSVGRGGTNNAADVKVVQAALGIPDDGKCGPQTIKAIENFQRSRGTSKADGRVDPGGPTLRALLGGGGGGAAPAPSAPSKPDEEEDDGLLGKIAKGAQGLVDDAKQLGGNLLTGGDSGLGGGLPSFDPSGGGTTNSLLGLIESYGGELAFAEKSLGKKPLGKYFELEIKVSGSVKFSGSKAGFDKPSKIEVEQGVLKFVESVFAEGVANFKTETGVGVKPNATKAGRGLNIGGAVAFKTTLGPLTIEFVTIEVSLVNFDPKKGLSGPKLSAGTSRSLGYKHTIRGVELEGAIAVTLNAELTPDYVGIAADVARNAFAEGTTSAAITMAIDVALVAGPPLAAAAVIGIGIFMAGEKGKRDAAIIEGAIDARKAAQDYAFIMTGSEASGTGPRAKAAAAVAKAQLAKVAASQKVSVEDLMTGLRADKNQASDFARIHAQARQRIFADYFAKVRSHLDEWRNEHSVLAAFTTAADDFASVEKKINVIFQKS